MPKGIGYGSMKTKKKNKGKKKAVKK